MFRTYNNISDRRVSRRKNHRRSLESMKKSFTVGNLVDANNIGSGHGISSGGSDILSSFRPTPLSQGCKQDIPETITEESESRRESIVDATVRKSSIGKKLETLADIVQSSEESGNSSTFISPWNDEIQSGAQNTSFCYSDSELDMLGMDCIPVSKSIPGKVVEQEVFQNEVNGSGAADSCPVTIEGVNALQYSVMGNSKIKPVQTETIEKAIGFLLESQSRRNKPKQPVKRVKFNYI